MEGAIARGTSSIGGDARVLAQHTIAAALVSPAMLAPWLMSALVSCETSDLRNRAGDRHIPHGDSHRHRTAVIMYCKLEGDEARKHPKGGLYLNVMT